MEKIILYTKQGNVEKVKDYEFVSVEVIDKKDSLTIKLSHEVSGKFIEQFENIDRVRIYTEGMCILEKEKNGRSNL